jgi:uracil-DNA glycosylase
MRELYDIAENIRKCTNCSRCRDRMLAIPGEGDGKIMIVGFSPGPEEDRLGMPFVNSKLNELLESISLTRKDCFLTYCLKCYSEKKEFTLECKKWLDQQISVIQPKLIVVLGEGVLKFLFNKYEFEKVCGSMIEKKYFIVSGLDSEEIIKEIKKIKI